MLPNPNSDKTEKHKPYLVAGELCNWRLPENILLENVQLPIVLNKKSSWDAEYKIKRNGQKTIVMKERVMVREGKDIKKIILNGKETEVYRILIRRSTKNECPNGKSEKIARRRISLFEIYHNSFLCVKPMEYQTCPRVYLEDEFTKYIVDLAPELYDSTKIVEQDLEFMHKYGFIERSQAKIKEEIQKCILPTRLLKLYYTFTNKIPATREEQKNHDKFMINAIKQTKEALKKGY